MILFFNAGFCFATETAASGGVENKTTSALLIAVVIVFDEIFDENFSINMDKRIKLFYDNLVLKKNEVEEDIDNDLPSLSF
jgi:hypothetical protein